MRIIDLYLNVCENVISYNRCFDNMCNRERIQWFSMLERLIEEGEVYDENEMGEVYDRMIDIYHQRIEKMNSLMKKELIDRDYFKN